MHSHRDQRRRDRVRLEIPARIRQIAPPRNAVELTTSLDVSRNGMLFRTRGRYDLHSVVWVALNYRSGQDGDALESPATVVRIDRAPDGAAEVALQFHSARADAFSAPAFAAPPHRAAPAQGAAPAARSSDRRDRTRTRIALPIRVRSSRLSEETQTVDVSRTGVLFATENDYAAGEAVHVVMPYRPGLDGEEVRARIVRTAPSPCGRLVALRFGH